MTPRKAFNRTANTLRCYNCGNEDLSKLRISNDVVRRKRRKRHDPKSKTYESVAIDCVVCGHQWYSTHQTALDRSRKSDVNLARHHGGQK